MNPNVSHCSQYSHSGAVPTASTNVRTRVAIAQASAADRTGPSTARPAAEAERQRRASTTTTPAPITIASEALDGRHHVLGRRREVDEQQVRATVIATLANGISSASVVARLLTSTVA